jgi:IS30 family transposase
VNQRNRGVPIPVASPHRLLPAEIRALLDAYTAGTLIEDIARQFSVHPTTVHAIIKRRGQATRAGVIDRNLDEARQLYEQGWSTARIGQRFDVAGDTVRRVLRKSGVTMRVQG